MRRVNKSGKSHFHKKRLLQARRWTKICPGPRSRHDPDRGQRNPGPLSVSQAQSAITSSSSVCERAREKEGRPPARAAASAAARASTTGEPDRRVGDAVGEAGACCAGGAGGGTGGGKTAGAGSCAVMGAHEGATVGHAGAAPTYAALGTPRSARSARSLAQMGLSADEAEAAAPRVSSRHEYGRGGVPPSGLTRDDRERREEARDLPPSRVTAALQQCSRSS